MRNLLRKAKNAVARAVPAHGPIAVASAKLAVVVDVTDDQAPFLDECLTQLMVQKIRHLQVVVSIYGEDKAARAVAERHARADRRIAVLLGRWESVAQARTRGIEHTNAEFIAFVSGSDVVPPGGYARLVRSLEASGSDFALGKLVVRRGAANQSKLSFGAEPRRRVALGDVPAAMTDTFIGNRLFRRSFWDDLAVTFDPGAGTTDARPALAAYLAATAFDIVPEPAYQRHERALGAPIGTIRPMIPHLASWLRHAREIDDLVIGAVREDWLRSVLDSGVQPFISDLESADDAQWTALSDVVRSCLERISPEAWSLVKAENKVRVWLSAHGTREDLEAFVALRWYESPHVPTRILDGAVCAGLPFFLDESRGIPRECFRMADSELPLVVSLRSLVWTGETTCTAELWAYIKYVDASRSNPTLAARMVADDGETRELSVEGLSRPGVTRFADDRFQNYDSCAFRVELNFEDLLRTARTWTLAVTLDVDGVSRSGGVTHLYRQGSAGALPSRTMGGAQVRFTSSRARPFRLEISHPQVSLETFSANGRSIVGKITGPADVTRLVATHGENAVRSKLEDRRFELTFPGEPGPFAPGSPVSWVLRAETSAGVDEPVAWPAGNHDLWIGAAPTASVVAARSARGDVELQEVAGRWCIDAVRTDAEALTFSGHWLGRPGDGWDLRLEGGGTSLEPVSVVAHELSLEAVFRTRRMWWGVPDRPIASGEYELTFGQAGSSAPRSAALASVEVLSRAGSDDMNELFRFGLRKRSGSSVVLAVQSPLGDDVLGNYAQERLRVRSARAELPIDEHGVYFQSYNGEVAGDSQLALHEELHSRGTDLRLYWAVADHATVLPDGALPLLTFSAEWHEKLARVRYLVNNVDFERRFAKRPQQKFLQTFHGYPSKVMGIGFWKTKNFSPLRIAAELQRTAEDWDLIITPTPEMNDHYREQYRYTGPIFDRGLPRNDALRSERAGDVRRRTRELLGISEDQVAVLYAPTWRDDIATGYESAPSVVHLDPRRAGAALGPDFVLLMRGHRFHLPAQQEAIGGARMVDVTSYPDVNDLLLASDVGVFDYSSMRFDFALTGRPMLFLVPDIDVYTGSARGFLFEYRDTTPGPLLKDTDEVVEALKNLDTVQQEFSAAYKQFNARFNSHHDGHAAQRLTDVFFDPGTE